MDQLQNDKFIMSFINDCNEVQTSISLIYNLIILIVNEIAHLWLSCNYQLIHLSNFQSTSFKKRCFSCCDKFEEYHFVKRERPCLEIKKKQWIIRLVLNIINICNMAVYRLYYCSNEK